MTVETKIQIQESQAVDPRLHVVASAIITRFRLEHGIPPFDGSTPERVARETGGRYNNRQATFTRDANGQETLVMKVENASFPTSFATIRAHPTNVLDGVFELSHAIHGVPAIKNNLPSTEIVEPQSIDEAEKLIDGMVSVFTPKKSK
ncbi:MAG: hypothetical protein WD992_00040 [Candidatus Levyibacteriota bacterium]